jgi:hypothetical protein
MRTIVAVAALIAAVASPAFAQTAPAAISGNLNLGSDPDANVRLDLMREAGSRNGSY